MIPVDVADGQPWKTADEYRHAGDGIVVREDSFVVVDSCDFRSFSEVPKTTSHVRQERQSRLRRQTHSARRCLRFFSRLRR